MFKRKMMNNFKMPVFEYQDVVMDYADLKYNPVDDLIFPSVIKIERNHNINAPAKWLMYYAPHDPPGGICLAMADEISGPWRNFDANPIISNNWSPHYSVSHVSSPHAVWNPEKKRIFLYFHGENSTTRFATSSDGVHFEYGGIAVTKAMYPDSWRAFYARVFRRPGINEPYKWIMFIVGRKYETDRSAIYTAWSIDGCKWETVQEALINAAPERGVCAPWLTEINGRDILLYHEDTPKENGIYHCDCVSDIKAYELNSKFTKANDLGVVFKHQSVADSNDRVSDPCIVEAEGKFWLFHTIGTRLNQKIAVATAKI